MPDNHAFVEAGHGRRVYLIPDVNAVRYERLLLALAARSELPNVEGSYFGERKIAVFRVIPASGMSTVAVDELLVALVAQHLGRRISIIG